MTTRSRRFHPAVLAALLLTGSVNAVAQDAPDLRRERRLHQNYKKFAQTPTPQEEWQEALSGVTEQNYQIQQGDTLWDISETFFGDAEFWPKIWSLNKEGIFNPHEIEPGDAVQFVPGTLGEAPSFAATEGDAAGAAPPTAAKKEDEVLTLEPSSEGTGDGKDANARQKKPQFIAADISGVKLPPPYKKGPRGAVNLPASLPLWSLRQNPDRVYNLQIRPVTRNPGASEITLLSYLTEENAANVGEIVEAEAGMHAAHENQYVVVKSKGAATGQKLLVVRDNGTLKAGERAGTILQIDGELTLQEPVKSSEGLFRAIVNRAFGPVQVGSQLMPGEVQRVVVDDSGGGGSEANTKVIGGPGGESREIFGPGDVLFLDAGASGGLAPGQTLNMYRREHIRDEDSNQPENPRLIGTVRIVRTSPGFATGFVSSAIEAIHVGDSANRAPHVK